MNPNLTFNQNISYEHLDEHFSEISMSFDIEMFNKYGNRYAVRPKLERSLDIMFLFDGGLLSCLRRRYDQTYL